MSAIDQMRELLERGTFDGWIESRDQGSWDDGRLQRCWWSPLWVPFASDGCGNMYCIDLSPGPNGTLGQIIDMETQDAQGPFAMRFRSFGELLADHVELLETGQFRIDEEGWSIEIERRDRGPR